MSKWIAYVGPFSFPWGQPGSRRVYGIAKALAECGYDVIVGSGQWGPDGAQQTINAQNIVYYNTGDSPAPGSSSIKKAIQLFYDSGKKTIEWLESMPSMPSYVFVYGAGAPFMQRIFKWCKTKNIPIIADVVEWYDSTHMPGGFFGPFHISAKISMHYYFPKCDGIIAISSLLENHYKSKSNAKIIRIPPTIDQLHFNSQQPQYNNSKKTVRLIYAGTPGKKDLLATIIRGVAKVDKSGKDLELIIAGPDELKVKDLMGGETLPASVTVLGRISQDLISEEIQKSDFSIILRESKRFANAGFPTKFVESLANGTPVIANYTSDIQLYLEDGTEGLVPRDCSISSLEETLIKAKSMTQEQLLEMRRSAHARALSSFDYKNYINELSDFLREISQ